MPPRTTKRTPAGPGSKRGVRGRAAATKAPPAVQQEEPKVDQDEVDLAEKMVTREEKTMVIEEKEMEPEKTIDTLEKLEKEDSSAKNFDAKEPIDEFEKDERLDLEDNYPEYEPDDYGVGYDDEKEIEQYPLQQRDEAEEGPDEVEGGEEEEGNVVEEEIMDEPYEFEHEEGDEHVADEHTEMIDAAEEQEHQEVVKERRKRKEFEIFVGGLDKDATESDLRDVFSKVGQVTEVRLMMNPLTKKNKGFAFLRFATVEQAKQACAQMKNPVVHGKPCGVSPSQDSDTLFLGNICKTWTKEVLKEKLKHYGAGNIEDLTLVEDSNNAGMNRGFAFLEFSSRSDAMDAFQRLQKRDVMFGVDRPAKVSFADSFIDPGDEIMAQVKTVFVDGISASWDEEYVKDLLKKYGEIEKVELARNMPSAKRRDFGFVTFDTHDAAVICAKSINNEELGEGDNKAKIRARLSRPLQRGKGKHIARTDFRSGRGSSRAVRSSWGHPTPRGNPLRNPRRIGTRLPYVPDRGFRRPTMAVSVRSRPVAPLPRSYDRRSPVLSYPKGGLKRDYGHREEFYPRGRAALDYESRLTSDRRPPYRDDYPPHASSYNDLPRGGASRSTTRRAYVDDGYSQRYERPPPTYREGRGHEYDFLPGSKRPYAAMDDVPPRYTEAGVRHSRSRLDYDLGSSSHYSDGYSDRMGRSNLGYGGSRSSLSRQDSHGLYNSRQGMNYSEGSYGDSDVGGMYSSNFGRDYISRGSDAGGSSYSSLYPRRGLGSNIYMGSSGSGSYY